VRWLGLALASALAISASAVACDGQPAPSAVGEPVRVRGAQFIEGELPPPSSGAPLVTAVTTQNPIVLAGQGEKLFQGRAGDTASAIAVRVDGAGHGYWVFPLDGPDPQYPRELAWAATCDFAALNPGPRVLRFAAIDARGAAGVPTDLAVCFGSKVPDNLNACDPSRAPPDAVLSLSWDANVDLDLVVVTPEGEEISAKSPLRGDAGVPTAERAKVDRDSFAGCARDGIRTENLVFPKRPSGTFVVYASLFEACGEPGVRFTFDAYEAEGEGLARRLVRKQTQSGRMIDLDATGGRDRGLFVAEYTF
jgi:hypothetical protein